jgi:type IV pilus assembly protein PilA
MNSTFLKTARKGFTLIELMVVVAIIGILAAMAMSAFSGATAKARNTKLKGNVKAMQSALEQTYAESTGVYGRAGISTGVNGSNFASGALPDGVTVSFNGTVGTTAKKYCIVSDVLNTTADSVNHGANCTAGANGVCTFTTTNPTKYCAANIQ